jgi:hypothetical protein
MSVVATMNHRQPRKHETTAPHRVDTACLSILRRKCATERQSRCPAAARLPRHTPYEHLARDDTGLAARARGQTRAVSVRVASGARNSVGFEVNDEVRQYRGAAGPRPERIRASNRGTQTFDQ